MTVNCKGTLLMYFGKLFRQFYDQHCVRIIYQITSHPSPKAQCIHRPFFRTPYSRATPYSILLATNNHTCVAYKALFLGFVSFASEARHIQLQRYSSALSHYPSIQDPFAWAVAC